MDVVDGFWVVVLGFWLLVLTLVVALNPEVVVDDDTGNSTHT